MSYANKTGAVKAKTAAFGNFIDPDREMVDVPNLSLVEVDLPEYERRGWLFVADLGPTHGLW